MLFHFSTELKLHVLHMAYLAVDFFFLLSGFVIAHAYEKRLASDLGFKTFAVQRVIRLYPMYIMGLLLALIPTILASEIGLPHQSRLRAEYGLMRIKCFPLMGQRGLSPPRWELIWYMPLY
jgi:peptidoglycan/LPS O-acetylase OafA/YrhL